MLEVTVKTLDSQNHSFSVPDESTVKEFKEQISPVLNIPVEKQRLIFCGKVLKDDKKLNEYDVNGKVIHVVQSLPPQSNASPSSSSSSTSSSGSSAGSGNTHNNRQALRDAAGFVLGAFTIPQDFLDPNHVQNIVQEVVSGMGELGRNATVISRTTDDVPSVDLRINLGQVPIQSEAQLRMSRVQWFIQRANHLLDSLEEGNSSNNISESSSQTDNDEELQSGLLEVNVNTIGERNEGSEARTESTTAQEETPMTASGTEIPVGDRFGLEGFAQVAQAALSAAIATATAAARAATSTMTSQPSSNETPSDNPSNAQAEATIMAEGIPVAEFLSSDASPIITSVGGIPMDAEFEAELAAEESLPRENLDSGSSGAEAPPAGTSDASNSTSQTAREAQRPSVQTLANLLDEVIRINNRVEPCIEKCRDLIRNDPALTGEELTNAYRLFRKTSKLLHFLSHAYHSLSDLHINFSSRPPRSPRVRIISSSQSVFHQAIPLQAQINISGTVVSVNSTTSSTTTTTVGNSATATNTTPSSTAQSTPTPEPRPSTATPTRNGTTSRSNSSVRSSPYASLGIPSGGRSINPMVYMEVSPGSITIDSITPIDNPRSATSSEEETSSTPGRETPNPPSAANARTRNETTTSDSRTTTSRASGRSQSAGAQGLLPPLRHLIPVPLTSMGSLQTFDSALPCHSVWALEASLTRRRHNAGGSTSQNNAHQRSSTTTVEMNAHSQPTAIPIPTPNAAGRLAEQLQEFNNFALTDLRQSFNTMFGQLGSDIIQRRATAHPLSRIRPHRFDSSRGGSSASQSSGNAANAKSNDFEDLIQSFLESIGPDDQHNLAHYLPISNQCPPTDIMGNMFWVFANELTVRDIAEAFRGNPRVLDKLQEPLLKFITEKIMRTPDGRDANMNTSVLKMISEICSYYFPLAESFTTRSSIDYEATMNGFFKQHIPQALTHVTSPDEGSGTYGECLSCVFEIVWQNFLAMHNMCVYNGDFLLKQAANQVLNSVFGEDSKSKLKLALFALAVRLISADTRSVDTERLKTFIVYKPQSEASKKPTDGPAASGDKKASKPRETAFQPRPSPEPRPGSRLHDLARIAYAESTRTYLRDSTRSSESRNSSPNLAEVVIGSESWHNGLPSDWVPIIARDVQRQRRQAPQSPFSNAYLSGMPSKRRKIMANCPPGLLQHSQSTLSDLLQQAITNANVKPVTSTEAVKKEASKDLNLQAAFTLHMKNTIQERLQRDLDYCSEKFPNARKYYDIDQV